MTDQEILDGAKENENEVYVLNGVVPYYATNYKQVKRSLADIRRIVELEKQLEEANECLTIAYMQGFSDCKDKLKGAE